MSIWNNNANLWTQNFEGLKRHSVLLKWKTDYTAIISYIWRGILKFIQRNIFHMTIFFTTDNGKRVGTTKWRRQLNIWS